MVAFTQTSSRQNIMTGDTHKTIFGKIKKWFSDMTVAAFAQVITSNEDLMALTRSGYLADALAVKNQFDVINGKLPTVYGFASLVVNVITTDYNQIDKALIVFDLKLDEVSRYSIEIWKNQTIVWYVKNATWNKVATYLPS